MANIRNQAIDKTFLSLDQAEERGFIHRDYIAHCFRWSHVCKFLAQQHRYKTARILDVGCGRELPLAKLLYSSRYIPEHYVGLDYGPIEEEAIKKFEGGKFPLETFEKMDFLNFAEAWQPNLITCFEVLEHVEPKHMLEMLRKMKRMLLGGGTIILSTPCYDEKTGAADNHVNEITHLALGAILEREGFRIDACYGTFASIKDYKDLLAADGAEELFNHLRGYYDTNVLSTIFAPLYPSRSRNNLWRLSHRSAADAYVPLFKPLEEAPTPWGSSALWKELAV